MIHHFDSEGFTYWEMEWPSHQRVLTSLGYVFANSTLTLKYKAGSTRDFPLLKECDGTMRFPGVDGHSWWMKRLKYPMDYSIAFIGNDGLLKRSLLVGLEF